MPVSKKPRKALRPRVVRQTTTTFIQVELRIRTAYQLLVEGQGFEVTHFDRIVLAHHLSCLLRLSDVEADGLNALANVLTAVRQQYQVTGSLVPGDADRTAIMNGICLMENIWSRYPRSYLETCYDKVLMELYHKTEEEIEKRQAAQTHAA